VEWTAVRILGASIACVSLCLVLVARYQLGAAFAVQAKAKVLVTTGLYARIRNPVYVFAELFLLGAAMVAQRWELLVLALAVVPVQVVRARREERVLQAAFGEEYARYKAATWF
jgi:protein-S-isoprenylcysteine O-methyltransferase Ste14